jgi:sugar-specific transcriptional regulator TrmB
MEKELFRELGFSERETRVYLALLELGETTVGPIAAKTRIQHSKVYPTLEKLIDKGLASFVIKSKTKYFAAQDPKLILSILKEKERRLEQLLPKLEQKRKFAKEKHVATVYEGYNGVKGMFETIIDGLGKKDYYYVFAFKEEYEKSKKVKRLLRSVHQRLAEKGVDDRLIAHTSIRNDFKETYRGIRNAKLGLININLPLGLVIVTGRVINFSWSERPIAVEIVSQSIGEQYRRFFLEMWKMAKK